MGDLVKGLGSLFGGSPRKPVMPGGMSQMDILLGQAMPSASQDGMSPNIASIDEYLRSSDPAGMEMPQEQQIEVEGFAPTKRNTLGRIADGILQAYGQKPIYEGRMQERDTKRALEGFTGDPEQAIERLIRINPSVGLPLWNQYKDNQRADDVANRQRQAMELKARDRVGALLGAAKPDGSNWEAVRNHAVRLAEYYNIDPSTIPTDFSPEAIEAWIYEALPVDDRLDNERDAWKTQYREGQQNARTAHVQDRTDSRYYHGQDRTDRRTSHVQDRIDRRAAQKDGKSGGPVQIVRDKTTGEVVGRLASSGKYAIMDNGQVYAVKADGTIGNRRPDLEE